MKRRILSFILALFLTLPLATPALAASDTGDFDLYTNLYQTITTATFIDRESDGRLLLSLSSSPSAATELLNGLSFVCDIVGAIHIGSFNLSSFIPGCEYVDLGGKFSEYVDKTMRLDVRLLDAASGDFVWEGTMKDGDVIFLGNDHPSGYRIECKSYGLCWAKLQVLENLNLS